MVILGGLELVAAGYVVHEYNKNKKEKREAQRLQQEQEEEDYRREEEERRRRRAQRRRHSASGDQYRPSRPPYSKQDDDKHGYKPTVAGPSQSQGGGYYGGAKPPAAVAGLYNAASSNGKHGYVNPSTSNLNVPAGPMRPNSAPGIHGYDPQRPGGPPAYGVPPYIPHQQYASSAGPQYYAPPPQAPNSYVPPPPPQILRPQNAIQYAPPPPTQAQPAQPSSSNQGWAPDHKYPLPPLEPGHRRHSIESLPLGIYEPPTHNHQAPPHGFHEMPANGGHGGHQSPHVRFRLPNDRVVGTGERSSLMISSEDAPPAYRP